MYISHGRGWVSRLSQVVSYLATEIFDRDHVTMRRRTYLYIKTSCQHSPVPNLHAGRSFTASSNVLLLYGRHSTQCIIKEGWRNWGIDSKRQVEDNNSKKETDKFCQLNFWGSLKKLTKTGLQCDSMYSYPSAYYELIQACSRSMISHLR